MEEVRNLFNFSLIRPSQISIFLRIFFNSLLASLETLLFFIEKLISLELSVAIVIFAIDLPFVVFTNSGFLTRRPTIIPLLISHHSFLS